MSRHPVRALPSRTGPLLLAALVLAAAMPARAQPASRPRGGEKAASDKPGKAAAAPVIACPSVANYRMLMQGGAPAAAAILADPKGDHLGCASLPRARIGNVVDRVTLAGKSYDCAAVQGTTVCHWLEAGKLPAAGEEGWR